MEYPNYLQCLLVKNGGRHFIYIFFIFSDMHLHAYSKANYQTNIQIPYAILHKLQIISGTSVQIRIKKPEILVKNERPKTEEEEQNDNFCFKCGEDCSM